MRGSFAAPLPILRQIFLRIVDGYRTVRYGGDHLPQRLGAHVAHGEHAGKIRAGGFVCHGMVLTRARKPLIYQAFFDFDHLILRHFYDTKAGL